MSILEQPQISLIFNTNPIINNRSKRKNKLDQATKPARIIQEKVSTY